MLRTSANVANAIVKLAAVDALPALMGDLVVGNLVNRYFEPSLARPGDTVSVPTPQGDMQVVLSTYAEATFQIPDVTKVLAVPDLLQLYMQPAVVALAEKIESDILSLYSQFTANSPVGTGGTALTEAVVDAAETAMFQAKVSAASPKYLVVDANAYSALRQIPRFSEYRTAGEAGLRGYPGGHVLINGPVGRIRDFYVFRSLFVPKTGSSPVTTNNLAFTRGAIGLAVRRLPQPLPGTGAIAEYAEMGNFGMRVVMDYRPNTLTQQLTVSVLYGCAMLCNDYGVQVRS